MSLAAYATRGSFDRLWSERVERARRNRCSRRRFERESPGQRAVFGPLILPDRRPSTGLCGRRHDDLHRRHHTGPEHGRGPVDHALFEVPQLASPTPGASTVTVHTPSRTERTRACSATTAAHDLPPQRDDAREHVGIGDAEVAAERARARRATAPVRRARASRVVLGDASRTRRATRRRAAMPGGSTPAVVSSVCPTGRLRTSASARRAVELAEHVVEQQHRCRTR